MRIMSTVFLEIRREHGMYDRELLSKKRNVTIPMDTFVNGDVTVSGEKRTFFEWGFEA